MKKFFTILLMLFAVISIAMAQPATMTKGQVDNSTQVDTNSICPGQDNRLNVQIVSVNGHGFHHPQHPETGATCPFTETFITNQSYSWYQWETSLPNFGWWTQDHFRADVIISGYLKVTVGDNYGNTGSDSIWFNVKDHITPLGNLIMEIDDDLHPKFSGIATEEHYKLRLSRYFIPGEFINHKNFFLSPGEWYYKDIDIIYHNDSLWLYEMVVFDTCNKYYYKEIPGLLLDSKGENNEFYLDMKTILQGNEFYYQTLSNLYYAYFVYTIDQFGQRHHYIDGNGNPVILPSETTSWHIPAPHIDPYYQCGVAQILEDGTYELLSLSNKVQNPLLDVTGTPEQNEKEKFSIYPNPNSGNFTVNGTGTLNVFNVLGQKITTKQVQGQTTLNLPRGLYILRFTSGGSNYTKKIVVNWDKLHVNKKTLTEFLMRVFLLLQFSLLDFLAQSKCIISASFVNPKLHKLKNNLCIKYKNNYIKKICCLPILRYPMANKSTKKILKFMMCVLVFWFFVINARDTTIKAEYSWWWLDQNFWSWLTYDDINTITNTEEMDILIKSSLLWYTKTNGDFIPSIYTKNWKKTYGSRLFVSQQPWIDKTNNTRIIVITWNVLDFYEKSQWDAEHWRQWCYRDTTTTCFRIYVLDTDYVIISWYITDTSLEYWHDLIGIISMRSGWTTLYTNQDVFFAANKLGNMILDNLHIDWWHTFTWSTKNRNSTSVFGNNIIYNLDVPKLWDATLNITVNNCSIANMSWYIMPISAQSNSYLWSVTFNNITTINNISQDSQGLFNFANIIDDNSIYEDFEPVIFNNRKSFDNLWPNQYNLMTRWWGISINNTYFNPWENQYNIFYDDWSITDPDPIVINNVVWTVYFWEGNATCYVHNIIWNIAWNQLCVLFWDRKHYHEQPTPVAGERYIDWNSRNWYYSNLDLNGDEDRRTTNIIDVGCLTYNYIINPFTWAINTTAKYLWITPAYYSNPNSAWCLDKTRLNNWRENVYKNLKYSFGKDIPTQVAPAKQNLNNGKIVYENIPYDTGKYIASDTNKLARTPDLITNNSDTNVLISWNAKVKLNVEWIPAYVFWPYIKNNNVYSISPTNSWWTDNIIFSNNYWYKLLISSIIMPDGLTHFIKPNLLYTWITLTPQCSSTYNWQTQHTSNSNPWLTDTSPLCDVWNLQNFSSSWTPRAFTRECKEWSQTVSCNATQQRCWDTEKNGSEDCDPNDPTHAWWNNNGYTCNNSCVLVTQTPGQTCWNGIIEWEESCDPGAGGNRDWCNNNCKLIKPECDIPTNTCATWFSLNCWPINSNLKIHYTINWTNPTCNSTYIWNSNPRQLSISNGQTNTYKLIRCNWNNSERSAIASYSYTKDTQWPNTPTLTSPANGTTIESFTPTLSWNPATDNGCSNTISWYKIIVCTGQIQCDDSHYLRSETTTSSTSISIPSGILQNWNWYKRKVKAKDGLWNRWDWSESTFTINIDTVGPTCERWTPSTSACISWWVAWSITLTCTDDVWIATTSLSTNNISYSWTLFTINSIFTETTLINTTRWFTVFYTSNTNANWTWRFTLNADSVKDTSNNSATPTSSSQIRVDTQAPSTPNMNQEPEFTSWTSNTVYSYTTTDHGCSSTVQYQFCKSTDANTNSCSSSNISSWLDGTSHTFTNLSDQKYYYFVRTKDWLGNIGSWSSSTYSTQDSIKPSITFDKNSGAAAGSHSVVVTVTDTWSKLANNSKLRYKWTTDSNCWWWTYEQTWLNQTTNYATTTVTTPDNIADGSYYLCIQWGMTSDKAWNTNNQTKTSWVFIIQLVCEITEASQCTNSQLELTLTANKDIQTPDGRIPKTLGWGWKVSKKIFTQNVTSNNTVSVTITDFSWSTATCSITPTNYDNVWPSFIFNNASWNECTWWQLIITSVNDTWCATWVTNVNIGEKIYRFNWWSWWKLATYTISAQQPWTITVTWEVRDNLWNISRKTATYTVVNVAPTANNFSTWEIWKTPRNITLSQFITASNAREWDCGTTHLTFSGVKTNGNIWTCSINNNILTYTPQANKQWNDTCVITIKDNENSTKDVTVTFNDIDTVPPTISITNNPTNFNQCTTWKTVTASINETGTILYYTTGGTCSNSWPYETWATNTRSFTKSFGSESDMWLYVCFKAIDLAWNEYYKTGTQIIKIDRTAPTFAMSWNFEWNTNNYPELYECETWFAEIINVNDTWCAWIPANAYSWDNWAFGNIKKNNFGNNTTWIKTVDIKVKDNLLNTSGATIKFIWRNRAINFLNTDTNTIHLENDMIDAVTINPIDTFWLTWRWSCEFIQIYTWYCSGATQTLQWTFPNYTLKIEPDEDLDSPWYCDISFKDCTKGNTTNCDSTLQWHIEFEVKTKDYYVVLDSIPGKSSWHIHDENDFDTGKISLIASNIRNWKPDFSDKYTIKDITRWRQEVWLHGTQRPDVTNINVEIEDFKFDDEDFNLCISWNIIVKIDTGFITDPAWNQSKATDITTNQTYELRQHLCASWITDDLLPWDNNKFEKIESTLRNSGFDLILLSTTALSWWIDSIECTWNSYSCPWFHCRDIWITGSVTEIQATGCMNDSSVYGYTKQYTLHIDPIDSGAFIYHEWIWSWQRRSDWTWCQIKIKGKCPNAYTTINMHIKMSAYKYWPIGSEDFYDYSLWSAISGWWWDNGFFFYISNPQIINIWWQSWLVWKINYEMYFDSWVADEFYTIQWTGIVNWYQQNLEIKRPTFNYSNPRGYLFNFPYYDYE